MEYSETRKELEKTYLVERVRDLKDRMMLGNFNTLQTDIQSIRDGIKNGIVTWEELGVEQTELNKIYYTHATRLLKALPRLVKYSDTKKLIDEIKLEIEKGSLDWNDLDTTEEILAKTLEQTDIGGSIID
ncbi:MAG: hypothetical protein JW816_00940 [Candidatus Buchananbacteria bacterium]|nr:hypothetical protein [Candidatus Buchananbacteria bacterium]